MADLKYVDEQGRQWYVIGKPPRTRLSVRTEAERNALYEQNRRLVYAVLEHRLGRAYQSHPLFDDLEQELGIWLLRALEKWRRELGKLSPYCWKALSRRLGELLEEAHRRKLSTLDGDVADPSSIPDPADERWATLYRLIDQLSARRRRVLTRYFGIRCPQANMEQQAAEDGVTRQCIQGVLRSAVEDLRRMLSPYERSLWDEASRESEPRSSARR